MFSGFSLSYLCPTAGAVSCVWSTKLHTVLNALLLSSRLDAELWATASAGIAGLLAVSSGPVRYFCVPLSPGRTARLSWVQRGGCCFFSTPAKNRRSPTNCSLGWQKTQAPDFSRQDVAKHQTAASTSTWSVRGVRLAPRLDAHGRSAQLGLPPCPGDTRHTHTHTRARPRADAAENKPTVFVS